jgi:hypothetical protein
MIKVDIKKSNDKYLVTEGIYMYLKRKLFHMGHAHG